MSQPTPPSGPRRAAEDIHSLFERHAQQHIRASDSDIINLTEAIIRKECAVKALNQRDLFEAWCARDGHDINRMPSGFYSDSTTLMMWFAWCASARRSRRGEECAELLASLKGVIAVADRNTDEFNRARAAIAAFEGGAAR